MLGLSPGIKIKISSKGELCAVNHRCIAAYVCVDTLCQNSMPRFQLRASKQQCLIDNLFTQFFCGLRR